MNEIYATITALSHYLQHGQLVEATVAAEQWLAAQPAAVHTAPMQQLILELLAQQKQQQQQHQINQKLGELGRMHDMMVQSTMRELLAQPRYQDPLRLQQYAYKIYSQSDEDGIIAEIFKRIGTTNKRVIEFGVETGVETNSTALLLAGWQALWFDGSTDYVATMQRNFQQWIASGHLQVTQAFITAENINNLISQHQFSGEIDLLSVDIDGNDYWVWQAINVVQPRVVIVEYNATWRPPLSLTIPYNPDYVWDGSNCSGCSLKAFEKLATEKGYCLVGCNLGGGNAFFVRQDLVAGLFKAPFTAEEHYEPSRYYLAIRGGHTPQLRPLVHI